MWCRRRVDLTTTELSPYQHWCWTIFAFSYSGWSKEVHFNLQVINKSIYGEIKHTIRMHIEWDTFLYINQDHSMSVCKDEVRRKKNSLVASSQSRSSYSSIEKKQLNTTNCTETSHDLYKCRELAWSCTIGCVCQWLQIARNIGITPLASSWFNEKNRNWSAENRYAAQL